MSATEYKIEQLESELCEIDPATVLYSQIVQELTVLRFEAEYERMEV